MPRHERLVRELERATAAPNLAPEEDLSLIDEASSLSNGPGRSAMESEIDELLAGGHFGHIPSIPEEVQETTDNELQVARGAQRNLLVANGAFTEMELLSNFDEVIWYDAPYRGPCSATRLADNLFLTAAHCLSKYHFDNEQRKFIKDKFWEDTPVQSACFHPEWRNAVLHMSEQDTTNHDIALMRFIDSGLRPGKTAKLAEHCPNPGETQRLIGWGGTGKFNTRGCLPEKDPEYYSGVQRSGIAKVDRITSQGGYCILTISPYRDANYQAEDGTVICPGDSGGFLGYLDDESGQLSQTAVISADIPYSAFDKHMGVCGDMPYAKWVKDVMDSDWASDPNCQYVKYQETGPVNEGRREGKRELLSLQLPDEARPESFGSPMQSSNRGLGMAGMGLIIGIPLLLLILYLMNKFSRTKNTDKAQSEQN